MRWIEQSAADVLHCADEQDRGRPVTATGVLTRRSTAVRSGQMGDDAAPPERLVVSASCTLDEVDGAPRITSVEISVRHELQSG